LKGYEPTARRSADLFVLDFSNPDSYLPADSRQLFLGPTLRMAERWKRPHIWRTIPLTRTTQLYDRLSDDVSLDEVVRILI
jgi:hypothetical protein